MRSKCCQSYLLLRSLPKSIWYLTDATWLGFRIVRTLDVPTVEEMFSAWNNGVARE